MASPALHDDVTAGDVTNVAAYRFAPLSDLKPWRAELVTRCRSLGLKGTILLSPEGINLFVAGGRVEVDALLDDLRRRSGLADLAAKYSVSATQPFTRLLVRIKREIIAFGVPGIDPSRHTVPRIHPRELRQWLDEGRPVVLLDTRNDYEVRLGTFRAARTLALAHFRDFPAAARLLPESLKTQPVVTFCTGGIRCEKAGAWLEQQGYTNVMQLDGGILRYFEECGSAHFAGECFVFDQRVGLSPGLEETRSAVCFRCQSPLLPEDQASPRYVPGTSCPFCWREPAAERARALAARQERLRQVVQPLPGSLPYDNYRPLKIPAECHSASVAEALARILPHRAAEFWAPMFAAGRLRTADGKILEPADRVRSGERVLQLMPGTIEPDVATDVRILHEDEAFVVVSKPAPLPVHAGGRYARNTLCHFLAGIYHQQKPLPAHRLDANTTGVMILSRTRHFASLVQPQFQQGKVRKHYLVRVLGHPARDLFVCTAPISDRTGPAGARSVAAADGLAARTEFCVLRRERNGTALLEARPVTGRTNQIRVHLHHLGHPVQGDPLYLGEGALGTLATLSVTDPPLCLHSWKIELEHPLERRRVAFTAEPPAWAGLLADA